MESLCMTLTTRLHIHTHSVHFEYAFAFFAQVTVRNQREQVVTYLRPPALRKFSQKDFTLVFAISSSEVGINFELSTWEKVQDQEQICFRFVLELHIHSLPQSFRFLNYLKIIEHSESGHARGRGAEQWLQDGRCALLMLLLAGQRWRLGGLRSRTQSEQSFLLTEKGGGRGWWQKRTWC